MSGIAGSSAVEPERGDWPSCSRREGTEGRYYKGRREAPTSRCFSGPIFPPSQENTTKDKSVSWVVSAEKKLQKREAAVKRLGTLCREVDKGQTRYCAMPPRTQEEDKQLYGPGQSGREAQAR